VRDGEAHCRNIGSGETREIPVDDLVVVRQFGEPIFLALVPMRRVQNGQIDEPWHTLVEADNYHALQLLEYLYNGKVIASISIRPTTRGRGTGSTTMTMWTRMMGGGIPSGWR
jgi:hypothetical protein